MKAIILLAVVFFSATSAKSMKPEYHWNDYYGSAPDNAIKVPANGTGEVFYVGQGYFPGVGLLPGMIKDGMMELKAVANGRVYTIHSNIKILSSSFPHPERAFYWLPMSYSNFEVLGDMKFIKFIEGGTETNTPVFIGRLNMPGFMNIGKIYTVAPYQGLNTVNRDGRIKVYKDFEALAMLNVYCDY